MKKNLNMFVLMSFFSVLFTLAIGCNEDIDPQLKVDVPSLSISSATNSTGTINIVSNTGWTVKSSETWLSVNPSEGTGNSAIAILAEQNADTTIRTATITVSAEKLSPIEVKVSQNGSQYDLAISQNKFEIDAAGGTGTFDITSNTTWTVASSESWLTVSTSEGSENASLIITAEKNAETTVRTAQITVTGTKTLPQTITVKQAGMVYELVFSSKKVTLEAQENSTATFDITTNMDWNITFEENWLTVEPKSGSGNGQVTITVKSNPKGALRSSLLSIFTEHITRQVVRINQNGIPCLPEDETSCEMSVCNVAVPSYASLPDNPFFPDPFMSLNGTRITSKSEWECRRAEIAVLAQDYEYGYKPCTPYEATTGTFNDNKITVKVENNGKSISFDCTITYPKTGTAPYPAIISYGYSTVASNIADLGIAVINFPNDQIANQSGPDSRGKGLFFDFFCSDHSAGAIIAWAWGISRVVDALEKTPEANINPERLAVTGCSRNGKGALAAGAFDERIALTIPQESGSGGAANWRVSDFMGSSVQQLKQIVGENCWFRKDFNRFGQTANKLPFDHHSIMGLCAPRGLLVIENTWQVWLGNLSCWTTGQAAHKIYEALGVPQNMGFSQSGHSDHCGFPESQLPELRAFAKRFLLDDETVEPYIMYTDGTFEYEVEKWIDWDVPNLK